MAESKTRVWGIVLAGGEGLRVRKFVQERFHQDLPKQYCAFTGSRTMLQHTIRRIRRTITADRIVVAVSEEHHRRATHELADIPEANILAQPFNRETAASILFPLLHIYQRDPEATIAIFPSDHLILQEERFMEHVDLAVEFVERRPKFLLLLGAEADEATADYGWIEQGMKIAECRGSDIYLVKRFWEKPAAHEARRLYRNHGLWNTMVMVSQAETLLRRFRRLTPRFFQLFKTVLTLLNSPYKEEAIRELYEYLPTLNFSRAILEESPQGLGVVCVSGVYWSDWGTEERIQRDLSRLRQNTS